MGATFNTHQDAAAKNTDNRIAYAVDEPRDFKEVYKADVPAWVNHWRYNWDVDVRLDRPADTVYAKFTGKPGVNVVRACLHVTPAIPAEPAMKITHGYSIGGKMTEKTVEMKAPGDYTIDCDGEVENVFLKMER